MKIERNTQGDYRIPSRQNPVSYAWRKARRLMLILTAVVTMSATFPNAAHAVTGGAGWQGKFILNIPAGRVDQFFHYACPAAFPVAISGGFLPNVAAKAGMVVLGNGPRLDLSPAGYNEWSWIIDWPNGAPVGASISFDVYCVAGPA